MAGKTVGRMWLVVPLDVAADPNKLVLVNGIGRDPGFGLQEAQPARAQPDNRRAERRPQVIVEDSPAEDSGYGFFPDSKTKNDIVVFTSEGKAKTYAEEQAALKPTRLYGVFKCGDIFETAQPTIITKQYNDAGELVLKPVAKTTTEPEVEL
jgi:hypothetical protein